MAPMATDQWEGRIDLTHPTLSIAGTWSRSTGARESG